MNLHCAIRKIRLLKFHPDIAEPLEKNISWFVSSPLKNLTTNLFIVFFSVPDDDENAAKVGAGIETTRTVKEYDHPKNPKVKFWDLPGIGTRNFPSEQYSKLVNLERYHLFLIFTVSRFTEYDLQLAREIKSMGKNFFFVRTKIDVDVQAEGRKRSFNEEALLQQIRADCSNNLGDLLSNQQDIFLISNHFPGKWDFERLTSAILEALPRCQRESLTLTLTRLSTNIVKQKVDILKGRTWMVATASAAAAVVPVPGFSIAVDSALILHEISCYRSQLCLPSLGSSDFFKLSVATQGRIRDVSIQSTAQLFAFLAPYALESGIEEYVRYVPFVGSAIASGLSFAVTFSALRGCLQKVEEASLAVIKESAEKGSEDLK